jgi:hypothetical protein
VHDDDLLLDRRQCGIIGNQPGIVPCLDVTHEDRGSVSPVNMSFASTPGSLYVATIAPTR